MFSNFTTCHILIGTSIVIFSWRDCSNNIDYYMCVLCRDDCWIPSYWSSGELEWHSICYWCLWILLCRTFCLSKYIPVYGWQKTVYQSIDNMVRYLTFNVTVTRYRSVLCESLIPQRISLHAVLFCVFWYMEALQSWDFSLLAMTLCLR